ncbi:MAG: hypothetical protein SFT68_02675 [Rickettsiaceae bacterium]|nr:hypothetical protein [Rickettsiaceae bacterium]
MGALRLISLLALIACSNIYKNLEIVDDLTRVRIDMDSKTPEEYDFEYRLNNLLNQNTNKESLYKLSVVFNIDTERLAVLNDTDTARERIVLDMKYKLYDDHQSEDKLLIDESFRLTSSYNTLFSPYSVDMEIEKTRRDLYLSSAEEIRRRLLLFFKQRKGSLK